MNNFPRKQSESRLEKLTVTCAVISISCVVVSVGLYFLGLRINTSQSIPLGVYWVIHKPITKGCYVIFCPPQQKLFDEALKRGYINPGFCKGGYGYLMKSVLAFKGDNISITEQGILINGQLLPYSKPLIQDDLGYPLPRLRFKNYCLRNTDLLLMTDNSPTSFDARYFGIISSSYIKAVIKPLFTWSTY